MAVPHVNRIKWWQAKLIALAAWNIPAAILFVIGERHSLAAAYYLLCAWYPIALAWGLRVIDPANWAGVNRAGRFYKIAQSGWHLFCLPGLIDKFTVRGDFKYVKRRLFLCDDKQPVAEGELLFEELDFEDDSAPVSATMWYRIGNVDQAPRELEEAVMKYLFVNDKADQAAVEIAEDDLRPRLQKHSIDKVNTELPVLTGESIEPISKGIEEFGLYLRKVNPVVVDDVKLSEATKKLRREVLEGEKDASKLGEQIGSSIRVTANMLAGKNAAGEQNPPTDEQLKEATRLWREERNRQTLEKTGANLTIFTDGMESAVVKTLNVK
jgi:regulator of protease activity HflC (stomatin/prohibitin superfamily)